MVFFSILPEGTTEKFVFSSSELIAESEHSRARPSSNVFEMQSSGTGTLLAQAPQMTVVTSTNIDDRRTSTVFRRRFLRPLCVVVIFEITSCPIYKVELIQDRISWQKDRFCMTKLLRVLLLFFLFVGSVVLWMRDTFTSFQSQDLQKKGKSSLVKRHVKKDSI